MINHDLLHTIEHTLEEIRRLSEVARSLIVAQQQGTRLPNATLAAYAEQLRAVDEQRESMLRLVAAFWREIEGGTPRRESLCPACDSEEIVLEKKGGREERVCRACGHEWVTVRIAAATGELQWEHEAYRGLALTKAREQPPPPGKKKRRKH